MEKDLNAELEAQLREAEMLKRWKAARHKISARRGGRKSYQSKRATSVFNAMEWGKKAI